MAIYTLNISSAALLRESLSTALTTAGIITTNHYDTSENLIVTTTRSNKVIRFLTTTIRLVVYYGDAYTSGTTITNQVTLNASFSATTDEAKLIVTADLLAIGYRSTGNQYTQVIFSKTNNVSPEYIVFSCSNNNTTSVHRDTTNNDDIHLMSFASPIVSSGGYYYLADIPVVSSDGGILSTGISEVKYLSRDWVTTAFLTQYGDYTTINGGGARGLSYYFRGSFLLENASTWAPE